ncbi:MAG: carbohydrate kinase family protein [Oscillospiraceae bacterium]|nr:carbohydrate kinase family protein [Oscillospiraceae bacterium]
MAKVMVAGHLCLDITPNFMSRQVEALSDILAPGKLINVGSADTHVGGVVCNVGQALKFFGVDVTLLAKVGNDSFGGVIREKLAVNNTSIHLIEDKNAVTSYSIVLAIPGLDRIFLHNPGTNDTFSETDISDELLDGISHFHFGYPPLMRRMYEDGGNELTKLFEKVKIKGITTSLDMAAVDPGSDSGRADWLKILSQVLPYVDFYLPSIEETGYMLDRAKYDEWNDRANGGDITQILNFEKDIRPMADRLIELGAKIVVLKCGELGMYYKTATRNQLSDLCLKRKLNVNEWCEKSDFEFSYLQKNVVSGTGAGDASIAAFLTSMLHGYSIHRSTQLAAAAGACCISANDALSGLKPLNVLSEQIDSGWEKVKFATA